MTNRKRNSVVCLAVAAALAVSAGAASAEGVTITCRQDQVFHPSDGGLAVLYLARQNVAGGTETVTLDGRALASGTDYSIDYGQGIVYLACPTDPGATLRVTYSVMPFELKSTYKLREPSSSPLAAKGQEPASVALRTAKSAYDLRASGSKTISIEAGSLSDLRMSQALDLAISGKIGDNVEVKGVLSDKDMSLGEATSTTSLEDLDRVFLEVSSPQARARVGDIQIDESPGELLNFKRELTGFFGDATVGPEKITLSGAQSRSKYETAEIAGREGLAGPYYFAGSGGQYAGIVVGSDQVWLDGQQMKRGRNADYVIDYEKGEIYFNPSRMIRDGARIVVDFESRGQEERRQTYYARSDLGLGKKTNLGVSFFNEGTISDTQSDLGPVAGLERSPGSPEEEGWTSGAKFAGFGSGNYAQVKSDTLIYYEYVGEGLGEYNVEFTWVGEGKGNYSYVFSDKWGREVHLYTGSGPYVDRVRQLPDLSARVVHVNASAEAADWLKVGGEFAASKGHKKADDGTWQMTDDKAYIVTVAGDRDLPAVAGHSAGAIGLSARRRWIGQNYLAVGRLQRPDVLERWAQDPQEGFEATNEMALSYKLGSMLRTSAEIGTMGTIEGDSRRNKYSVDLGSSRLGLSASSEVADLASASGPRGIEHKSVAVRVPVKALGLEFGTTSDLKDRLSGSESSNLVEYFSRAGLARQGLSVLLSISGGKETRGSARDSLAPYSTSLDGSLKFEADLGKRASLRGQVAGRQVNYDARTQLAANRTTGADLGVSLRDMLAISTLSADYSLANTLTSSYATELIKVGMGADYDSAGNYVPGAGAYDIARHETGKQPVTRMKASLALETGIKGKILLARSLSSRTRIEIEGESSRGNAGDLAVPNPFFVLKMDEVTYGRVNLNEEIVINRVRGLTISLTGRATRSVDQRCLERGERDASTEVVARVATNGLAKMTASAEGRFESNRRWIETPLSMIAPSDRIWGLSSSLERAIATSLRARLAAGIESDTRGNPYSDLVEATCSPSFTLFVGPLRCDGGVGLRRLVKSDKVSVYEARSRNSVDWNSRINLRQGKYTSFSFEYVGRKAQGLSAIHNLKASLSATF